MIECEGSTRSRLLVSHTAEMYIVLASPTAVCVYVCVCVCERERERESACVKTAHDLDDRDCCHTTEMYNVPASPTAACNG